MKEENQTSKRQNAAVRVGESSHDKQPLSRLSQICSV